MFDSYLGIIDGDTCDLTFWMTVLVQVYEATFKDKQVALKIFLDTRSMNENSFEGLTAATADIVEKMEKVRNVTGYNNCWLDHLGLQTLLCIYRK